MEYITVNGTEYACQSVKTSTSAIAFVLESDLEIADVKATFGDVTSLTVAGENKETYGNYENVSFESATVYADGSIEVVMHIMSEEEVRLISLETTQAEQDEMIAELMFGGDE